MLKNVLLLSVLFVFMQSSFAYEGLSYYDSYVINSVPKENIVELNLSDEDNIDFRKVKKATVRHNAIKFKKHSKNNDVYDTILYEDVNKLVPEEQSLSKSLEREILDDTFVGTKYKTTVNDGNKKDTFSLFSKYKNDKFSLVSSFDSKKTMFKKERKRRSLSLTPEYEFNDYISIKNVNSSNFYNKERKSEVVLSLTPFDDDRFDFNIGAGKTYKQDRKHPNSQLNFSTQFRF